MILATVQVTEGGVQLGKWEFSALPVEGHVIAITLNDKPTFFRVDSVFHMPVLFPGVTPAKVAVPRVTVMVHALPALDTEQPE